MEWMGNSPGSRRSRAAGGPAEAGPARTIYERQVSPSSPAEHPFIPPQLVRIADGSIPDVLTVALDYIEQLPPAFREALPKYLLNQELLSDMRDMLVGFEGIRRRDLDSLTGEQIEAASTPNPKVRELSEGLSDALFNEPLPPDMSSFARINILRPLKELAETMLSHPLERSLLRQWAHRVMEEREQRGAQGPPLPEPH